MPVAKRPNNVCTNWRSNVFKDSSEIQSSFNKSKYSFSGRPAFEIIAYIKPKLIHFQLLFKQKIQRIQNNRIYELAKT